MSTTADDDLDRDDVVIALRREGEVQHVRPAPLEQVAARGRRRRARRRASVTVVSVAAALLVGAVALAAIVDRPADQVRTAQDPATVSGPGIEPLLVASTATGQEPEADGLPVIHVAEMDLLDASGERTPWSRWAPDQEWVFSDGIVLADGRRFASARGATDPEGTGELALVELDETGAVRRALPLGVEAPQDPNTSGSTRIVGATGSEVDVAVTWTTDPEIDPTAPRTPQPIVIVTSVVAVDVDTGAVATIVPEAVDTDHRTAGDRIVSVRARVSTTEACLLDVAARATPDDARSVAVACDMSGPLPPMVRLLALDPTGRYAAVERTTLTDGAPELSLLVVDVEDETTSELITTTATVWTDLAFDAAGTLRLAMPAGNPELPPVDVASPPGGPEVELLRY
ncbi:MAG: hypothetical protein KDA97_00315 [Acidimicrobiales bacterium]|nr:hypothetical protein [Acidimicrobiales bacterium]